MSTIKHFLKDTLIYGLATVLPRVINFLLVKIHTDALPANSYADNTNFYIWAGLLAVLLTYGMETSFFRFYNTDNKKDAIISTSFISILVTTIVFVILGYSFSNFFINIFDFEENPLRLKLLIAILAIDTLSIVPFAYLRATNKSISYATIKLMNVFVIVVINLLFLKYIPIYLEKGNVLPEFIQHNYDLTPKVNYIFIANLVGSAISFLMLIPYLVKFKISFELVLLKKMLNYGWPILVAGIAYVINENLDKYLIGKMMDKEAMGIYSAVYKLAIFMNLYIMAFKLGAEPFFFSQQSKENAKEIYAQIMKYFTIVGAFALLGIVAFIDILKHFINENYWSALAIVPIVLLANLLLGMYHNLSVWYKLTDKTRFAMYFSLLAAFVTVAVNLIFIPMMGYMASAWATLLAYGSMVIASYFYGKRYYPVPYEIKKIMNYIFLSVGLSTLSFLYFREQSYVSLAMLLIFGGFIYWNEQAQLKLLFKKSIKNEGSNSQ
ncbi:MAG: oligosaccharide flippase family protein [Flavobacteriaceae bacterium]|nr:oligosaccharide flippase family protein [Flavobacteriaceae bacterium]